MYQIWDLSSFVAIPSALAFLCELNVFYSLNYILPNEIFVHLPGYNYPNFQTLPGCPNAHSFHKEYGILSFNMWFLPRAFLLFS